MKRADGSFRGAGNSGERGGSRLNLLIVVALIAVVGYTAYQFAPVLYNASLYKVYMQDTVNQAAATGKAVEWVQSQLRAGAAAHGAPPGAVVEAASKPGAIEARVRFTRPVPLPGYVYQYEFDHTVRSSGFFNQN